MNGGLKSLEHNYLVPSWLNLKFICSLVLKKNLSVCGLMMNVVVQTSIRATLSLPKIDLEQALELIYWSVNKPDLLSNLERWKASRTF